MLKSFELLKIQSSLLIVSEKMSQQIQTTWNLDEIDSKIQTIQKQLLPYISQAISLDNAETFRQKKKEKLKGNALLNVVKQTAENFLLQAQQISMANPDVSGRLNEAIEKVKAAEQQMCEVSTEFLEKPSVSKNRLDIIQTAKNVLVAITEVMIIADMLSISPMTAVEDLLLITTTDDYQKRINQLNLATDNLLTSENGNERKDLISARAELRKYRNFCELAFSTYLNNPNAPHIKDLCQSVVKQTCEAISKIETLRTTTTTTTSYDQTDLQSGLIGELDAINNNLDNDLDEKKKKALESQLEAIERELADLSHSKCIAADRKDGLYKACDNLRDKLQNVLAAFEDNLTNNKRDELLNDAKKSIKSLKMQLNKAADQDSLLNAASHLENMIRAAKMGDMANCDKHAELFSGHNEQILTLASYMSKLSNDEEAKSSALEASNNIKMLYPQLCNAARVLAFQPESQVSNENVEAFKEYYEEQLGRLTQAIDQITTINEFLAVSDTRILEDIRKCADALRNGDFETFESLIELIGERLKRIVRLVEDEMENYDMDVYKKEVLEAVRILNENIIPEFNGKIHQITVNYTENPTSNNEDDFIDASNMLYDGIREIRTAILMNTPNDELDEDEVELDNIIQTDDVNIDEYPEVEGIDNTQELMANLPQSEKEKIQEQSKIFMKEKDKLDEAIKNWHVGDNDLVLLAKKMAKFLSSMNDFTNGIGGIKTTHQLINVAEEISKCGNQFEKLTKEIVNQVPNSKFNEDLILYSTNVNLYCHQLKIISGVKRDVQFQGGEMVVSQLDSATSLIKNAKNLLEVVVKILQTVILVSVENKSAKSVLWKRKLPEKKPLFIMETAPNSGVLRKPSIRRVNQAVEEFHSLDELKF